jgi:uncharacterized Zn finger protein
VDALRREHIVAALTKRGVNQPCPRCGHPNFSVVGETEIPVSPEPSFGVSSPVIPVVIVACQNCGYVNQHATTVLDLAGEVAHAG